MPIPNSEPIRFTPRGLADAYDATDVFPGACRKLINLVFDQSNPEIVIPRPGVGTALTTFGSFTTPGFISVQITVGQFVYGMVATGLTANKDQPFCWDLKNSAFITVSGCTAGNAENRPTSPATSGDWVPPTMAVIGTKIIITHPGYSGAAGVFFGVIDISNPAAPAYSTANTATNALPSVPTGVANLNNRAYYICGNKVFYSDVLVPTTMTTAGQAVTLGDSAGILVLSGLPVQTSTGGVVSALLAFKATQIWQINGDAASTTVPLSTNYLSLNIGCASPRTVVPTPAGTYFAGPDACYVIDPSGLVAPVVKEGGTPDIRRPFGYITTPTRAAAAFAGNIYRVCMQTIIDGVSGTYDYWFDTRKMRWNGPHTFAYDCASSAGTNFILTGIGNPNKLFLSNVFPFVGSIYTDDNAAYTIDLLSATYPKQGEMAMKQMVESTIELSSIGTGVTYGINVFDDKDDFIASTGVVPGQPGVLWGGGAKWGDGSKWRSGTQSKPRTYALAWASPVVFNKLAIEVTAPAASGQSIGTFYGRFQYTNYTLQG